MNGVLKNDSRPFFDHLRARIADTGGCLVVGLDPRPEDLDPALDPRAALIAHADHLIAETADLAVAWKPNTAFYEAFGSAGWAALEAILPRLQRHAPVLLDAKRGDIGTTAQAYAQAVFGHLDADAVTLHPWLGEDSVAPFLADARRGVFFLARTSNPGAAELQALDSGGEPLWARVVAAAQRWTAAASCELGLVVGATAPDVLAEVRRRAPSAWILAPGVGAQGGDLEAILAAGQRDATHGGAGLLVPVSRGLSRAPEGPRAAALALVARMREVSTPQAPTSTLTPSLARLADLLFARECVRFGTFTLKSGIQSPIYIDLRRLVTFPDLMSLAAQAYRDLLLTLRFDRLAALPYAALPIGTAVSLAGQWPMVYPRREAKDYGTQVAIEGLFEKGDRVVVLDDVATRGDSKLEAFDRLEGAGLVIDDVVVLIDREGGARALVEARGKRFHAVFTLSQLVDHWLATGRIDLARATTVRDFLSASA